MYIQALTRTADQCKIINIVSYGGGYWYKLINTLQLCIGVLLLSSAVDIIMSSLYQYPDHYHGQNLTVSIHGDIFPLKGLKIKLIFIK